MNAANKTVLEKKKKTTNISAKASLQLLVNYSKYREKRPRQDKSANMMSVKEASLLQSGGKGATFIRENAQSDRDDTVLQIVQHRSDNVPECFHKNCGCWSEF